MCVEAVIWQPLFFYYSLFDIFFFGTYLKHIEKYYALLGDFLLLEPEFCSGQILIVSFEDALLFLQG
ncbi:hypothetical protein DW107_00105 [Tannerella sp. AM09-19]|nr:hypothetical protein DW107_00105 [Tannerella sp. AM09-19]